jgi:hypothetical protein
MHQHRALTLSELAFRSEAIMKLIICAFIDFRYVVIIKADVVLEESEFRVCGYGSATRNQVRINLSER